MKISIAVPPSPMSVELAKAAEDLGYERIWLYDSACLYEDIWIHLALMGQETDRIGLGTAVLVPNLRHVMTTASAIATVERLAPGRLAVAIGTGFTARLVMNKNALSWATTERYIRQLRGLLAGEVVEIDGEPCQMVHLPSMAVPRPIDVPLLLSAFGPKGQAIAEQTADGLMHVAPPAEGQQWDWWVQMINGTVLDEGEDPLDDRPIDAAGPWWTVGYHAMWHMGGDEVVATMPGGEEWVAGINAERPEGERHLVVHEGHCSHVTDRDRPLFDAAGDGFAWSGWVGEADEIRRRRDEAAAAGTTELLYTPAGDDLIREVKAFADAVL